MLRAAVLLQASLRGRAAQTHLWEELGRYRDVVQEVMGPLGPADGLGQGSGPKARPRTPQLHDDAKDEVSEGRAKGLRASERVGGRHALVTPLPRQPLPALFANLKDTVGDKVTVADIIEAIAEEMMHLRVDPSAAEALADASPPVPSASRTAASRSTRGSRSRGSGSEVGR